MQTRSEVTVISHVSMNTDEMIRLQTALVGRRMSTRSSKAEISDTFDEEIVQRFIEELDVARAETERLLQSLPVREV